MLSGDPGITGPRGSIGESGLKGERGDRGLQGPPGNMSEVDMEHMKGEKGDFGNRGENQHTGPLLNERICIDSFQAVPLLILSIYSLFKKYVNVMFH